MTSNKAVVGSDDDEAIRRLIEVAREFGVIVEVGSTQAELESAGGFLDSHSYRTTRVPEAEMNARQRK